MHFSARSREETALSTSRVTTTQLTLRRRPQIQGQMRIRQSSRLAKRVLSFPFHGNEISPSASCCSSRWFDDFNKMWWQPYRSVHLVKSAMTVNREVHPKYLNRPIRFA